MKTASNINQYDAFISYSHHDRDRVENWLLPRLEAAGLRICIDFRTFIAGKPSLDNIEYAVNNSRKTLIVLTPAWIESEWGEFESLLAQSVDPAGREGRMIPLLFEPCDPRGHIAMLAYLDFTREAEIEIQAHRLITAIRGKADERRRIIFYAPTFRENLFYNELLDRIIELATKDDIEVIARNAIGPDWHEGTEFMKVINMYENQRYEDTVIVMVPPSPQSYRYIFRHTNPDAKINLITLDMDVPDEYEDKLRACKFLKKVIVFDNEKGADKAAEIVERYCQNYKTEIFNLILCEGHFHNRGHLFKKSLEERGLTPHRILDEEEGGLSFSSAIDEAYRHVREVIEGHKNEIIGEATFIFCANDNMVLGARAAVSGLAPSLGIGSEDSATDIRIIGFDATYIIKHYVKRRDRYVYGSVNHNYKKYAERVVYWAKMILNKGRISERRYRLPPGRSFRQYL